jgi:hypothetical protein
MIVGLAQAGLIPPQAPTIECPLRIKNSKTNRHGTVRPLQLEMPWLLTRMLIMDTSTAEFLRSATPPLEYAAAGMSW